MSTSAAQPSWFQTYADTVGGIWSDVTDTVQAGVDWPWESTENVLVTMSGDAKEAGTVISNNATDALKTGLNKAPDVAFWGALGTAGGAVFAAAALAGLLYVGLKGYKSVR